MAKRPIAFKKKALNQTGDILSKLSSFSLETGCVSDTFHMMRLSSFFTGECVTTAS